MVSAQSLRGYRELVSDLGGNPTRLLRKVGIEPVALDQLTAFIGFASLIELLERSAVELDCPDFGLRLAERQDLGILGLLSTAMRYSATVGEATLCASKYLQVYNAAVAFTVNTEERRGEARLGFNILVEHSPRWAQTAEHGIGLAWRICTLLSEGRSQIREVWFPHAPVGSEASYHSRFNARLAFGSDRFGLAVSVRDLRLPISESHQELHDLAASYLDDMLPRGRTPFTLLVRHATEALLGTGTCGCGEVARALFMHPRTLQRRLREEGTTFEAIKDDVRRDFAQRYLSHQDMPLAQVSALLDYSDQSALTRSCHRWFHTTPRTLRTRLLPATA